jgi:predicted DNA-binding protein YlxM (UPF0122 family)
MFCYSVTKTEKNNLEQRHAIKFRAKLGESAADTYETIQKAFGNDSLSRAQVFRWHKDFANGRETVEDEPRSGRPASVRTSTNVDPVRAFVRQDRRLTIRMIADELNINKSAVHQIVTHDLNTGKVCAKMISKNLNDDQNARRKELSAEMLERLETEPGFLNRVVTGDESCRRVFAQVRCWTLS